MYRKLIKQVEKINLFHYLPQTLHFDREYGPCYVETGADRSAVHQH
jgi:hypothetical protein